MTFVAVLNCGDGWGRVCSRVDSTAASDAPAEEDQSAEEKAQGVVRGTDVLLGAAAVGGVMLVQFGREFR